MTVALKTKEVGAQPLSKETISQFRPLTTAEPFARGQGYFDRGAVSDLRRRGDH
jgi:hypothetical protein